MMVQIDWTWIIVGAVFTIVVLRLLTNVVAEIFFFGVVLAGIEAYKYWFIPDLGFPLAPEWIYKFAAGVMLSWIVARIIWLVADQWFKPARILSKIVFGHNAHGSGHRKKMLG